jgi:hypothetical protein
MWFVTHCFSDSCDSVTCLFTLFFDACSSAAGCDGFFPPTYYDFNFEYYRLLIRFDSKSTVNSEIILLGTTTYDNLVICSGHKILVIYIPYKKENHIALS